MTTTFDFKNANVLVTGAGQGIGRDLCKALLKSNANKIFAISRTECHLTSLVLEVEKISENKNRIIPIVLDLSEKVEIIQNKLKKYFEEFEINYLVNNAGVGNLTSFLNVSSEEYDNLFNVNVKAVIFVSQIFAKYFNERYEKSVLRKSEIPNGAIVNVSSQASQAPLLDHTLYCTSKAALDMITKMMALELGKKCKLRINSVNPTVVLTELGRKAWSEPTKANSMLCKIPLEKFAEISHVVDVILFLLSDNSEMIHGSQIPIDGGFMNCR